MARQGESAEPPGVFYQRQMINRLSEEFGFESCCTAAFELVLLGWSNFVLAQTTTTDARGVARALAHGGVAPAFFDYLMGDDDLESELLSEFASHLIPLSGNLSAPGHYLLALCAERGGRTIEAERELKAAISANPGFEVASLELSRYAADRGDARLALSLLQRSGALESDPEIAYLRLRLGVPVIGVGRNDPCPCGSGSKFKSCCINGRRPTIEDRADWLGHKIVLFSLRPQNLWRLEQLLDIAAAAAREQSPDSYFSVLVNLAAFDPEAMEDFIDARGVLLPEDELALARRWRDASPSMWHVVAVHPGGSVDVFDTREGESVVIRDHSASQALHVGDYVFARVVPAGSSFLFAGEIVNVPLARRDSLLKLLSAGATTQDVAAWVGRLFAPIHLANYEGESVVLCRAVLAPVTTSWKELSKTLDRLFEESDDGKWTELVEMNGESVVRCILRREIESLVVETNSVERFDRILNVLREEVSDLRNHR